MLASASWFNPVVVSVRTRLISKAKAVFIETLNCPPFNPQVTLQYLWEKEYQVLVFYHHPMALEVPFLWPGQMMPSPWANTTDPEKLVQFLQASVTDRRSASAFIPLGFSWRNLYFFVKMSCKTKSLHPPFSDQSFCALQKQTCQINSHLLNTGLRWPGMLHFSECSC